VQAALERHVQYLEKQLRESQQEGKDMLEWLKTTKMASAAKEEEAKTWM
jgi:DNA-directed RNA polymerase alpha subunit